MQMSPRKRKRSWLKFERQPWQRVSWLRFVVFDHRRSTQILGNYPNFGQDRLHPHPLQFTNNLTNRRYIQTTALFRKVRRKLNSWQTELSVHMVNYISIYNGVQLKSNSQWNLIGRSTTGLPPVLSPSIIDLLPHSFHGACLSAKKNQVQV